MATRHVLQPRSGEASSTVHAGEIRAAFPRPPLELASWARCRRDQLVALTCDVGGKARWKSTSGCPSCESQRRGFRVSTSRVSVCAGMHGAALGVCWATLDLLATAKRERLFAARPSVMSCRRPAVSRLWWEWVQRGAQQMQGPCCVWRAFVKASPVQHWPPGRGRLLSECPPRVSLWGRGQGRGRMVTSPAGGGVAWKQPRGSQTGPCHLLALGREGPGRPRGRRVHITGKDSREHEEGEGHPRGGGEKVESASVTTAGVTATAPLIPGTSLGRLGLTGVNPVLAQNLHFPISIPPHSWGTCEALAGASLRTAEVDHLSVRKVAVSVFG